jgi:hypothetical protein
MRNISMIPVLSIGGVGVFATTTSQQGFSANDFNAKASALPRQQFRLSRTFDDSGRCPPLELLLVLRSLKTIR